MDSLSLAPNVESDIVELDCGKGLVGGLGQGSAPTIGHGGRIDGDDNGADDDTETDIMFFLLSHVQLGRRKMYEKGALSTSDLGIQVVPVIERQQLQQPLQQQQEIFLLDLSGYSEATPLTKLATWMNDSGVTAESLRRSWQVWQTGEFSDDFSSHLWNLQRLNLQAAMPEFRGDIESVRCFLESMIKAKAFGSSRFAFVPGPCDADGGDVDALLRAGFIVQFQEGYKCLVYRL